MANPGNSFGNGAERQFDLGKISPSTRGALAQMRSHAARDVSSSRASVGPTASQQFATEKFKPTIGAVDIGQKGYLASTPVSTGSSGVSASVGFKQIDDGARKKAFGIGFSISG